MNTREKLKLGWANLLKMSEKGSVAIYYRGITEHGIKLYEMKNGDEINGIMSGAKLLEVLAKKEGENERR